jgi:hypothetical protein
MIIRPFEKKEKEAAKKNEVYYDEFGNMNYDIFKRLVLSPRNRCGRMEKQTRVINHEDDTNVIFKECAVGSLETRNETTELSFNDYSCLVTDYESGEYIASGGWNPCPVYGHLRNPYIESGYLPFPIYGFVPIDDISWNRKINQKLNYYYFIESLIDSEINSYENILQLPYADTIGLVNAFCTTWTYTFPFEAFILIDSKRKQFNIPRLKSLPGTSNDILKKIYIKLLKDAGRLSEYLSYIINKERNYYIFRLFIHPFGSTIEISNPYIKECRYLNNPDQVRSVIKNARAGGNKYSYSESLDILRNSGMAKGPVEDALECCDLIIHDFNQNFIA